MNVNALSSSSGSAVAASLSVARHLTVSESTQDGATSDTRAAGGHHRPGGGLGRELAQALQSLGLTLPGGAGGNGPPGGPAMPLGGTPPSGPPPGGPPPGGPPPAGGPGGHDGDADDSSSADSQSVEGALGQFLQTLIEAAKATESDSTGSTDGSSSSSTGDAADSGATATRGHSGRPDFATDLAALLAQVSSGSAPDKLQSAFDKLMGALGASSTGGTASDGSASPVNLQQLLSALQTQVGYGPSQRSTAGSLVDTTA